MKIALTQSEKTNIVEFCNDDCFMDAIKYLISIHPMNFEDALAIVDELAENSARQNALADLVSSPTIQPKITTPI